MNATLHGFMDRLDHVSCRYRLRAYVQHLESRGWGVQLQSLPRSRTLRMVSLRDCHRAEVVVLQRKLLHSLPLRWLRRNSRRLVFDFDDALFRRDCFAEKPPHCKRRSRRFRRTIEMADVVLAGNRFLAEAAAEHTDAGRIWVIPTCVNLDNYPPPPAHPRRVRGDPVELVWIGSGSTVHALDRRRDYFEFIGRSIPDVRLKVICDSFPRYQSLPVVPVVWSSDIEADELASAHIGISWLPGDDWVRGKCGLKVIQYMAAGLPVVTNPVGVHVDMVEDGVSGFLVESHEEWVDAIRKLANDPELAHSMGLRGRQIVEEKYNLARWAPVLEEALESSVVKANGTAGGRAHPPSNGHGLVANLAHLP